MLITSDFIYMFFFSILVRIAPIIRNNIKKKKKKSAFLKEAGLPKIFLTIAAERKIVNQGLFILHDSKWRTKHH